MNMLYDQRQLTTTLQSLRQEKYFESEFSYDQRVRKMQRVILDHLDSLYGVSHRFRNEYFPSPLISEEPRQIIEFTSSTNFSKQLNEALQPIHGTKSAQSSTQQTLDAGLSYRQKAIERYKSKKYRYTTQVNYTCRKIVADSRPRLKGKFISKEEQQQIQEFMNGNPIENLLDEKRNIKLKDFIVKAKLFTNIQISRKKVNQSTISDVLETKQRIEKQILKKISKKQQLFQIETR